MSRRAGDPAEQPPAGPGAAADIRVRRPGRYLVPALLVLLGLIVMAGALGVEARRADQRLADITVSYSTTLGVGTAHSGTAVPTADDLRLGRMLRELSLWYSLHNHVVDTTWHWHVSVATHEAQLEATPRLPLYTAHPVYRWAEPGTVVPFAGGLLLALGGLFAAAARWRRPVRNARRASARSGVS